MYFQLSDISDGVGPVLLEVENELSVAKMSRLQLKRGGTKVWEQALTSDIAAVAGSRSVGNLNQGCPISDLGPKILPILSPYLTYLFDVIYC